MQNAGSQKEKQNNGFEIRYILPGEKERVLFLHPNCFANSVTYSRSFVNKFAAWRGEC
jgi:hypothetical protein